MNTLRIEKLKFEFPILDAVKINNRFLIVAWSTQNGKLFVLSDLKKDFNNQLVLSSSSILQIYLHIRKSLDEYN